MPCSSYTVNYYKLRTVSLASQYTHYYYSWQYCNLQQSLFNEVKVVLWPQFQFGPRYWFWHLNRGCLQCWWSCAVRLDTTTEAFEHWVHHLWNPVSIKNHNTVKTTSLDTVSTKIYYYKVQSGPFIRLHYSYKWYCPRCHLEARSYEFSYGHSLSKYLNNLKIFFKSVFLHHISEFNLVTLLLPVSQN